MNDVTYSVQAEARTATRLDVTARNFTLVIDEPEKLGGTNAGPNPLEYELASLAGCLNVTGHLVAKELGITIDRMGMTLSGTLNPARFMGRGDDERAGFKEISVTLDVDCSSDAATIDQWRHALEKRCPVSDNLADGTLLNIVIKEAR